MNALEQAKSALEKIEQARQVVNALSEGTLRWTMSVPARPDSDPDLVIAGALQSALEVISALSSAETAEPIAEVRSHNPLDLFGTQLTAPLPVGAKLYAAPQQAAQPASAGMTEELPPLPLEDEQSIHIYPSDLARMERSETTSTVFSVAVGAPDSGERSVPLYTAHQMRERDVMWQAKINALLARGKELELDAARYRFLRPMLKFDFSTHRTDPHKDIADLVDEYLDAEIAAEQLNTTKEK
jgi:hypothetical protein